MGYFYSLFIGLVIGFFIALFLVNPPEVRNVGFCAGVVSVRYPESGYEYKDGCWAVMPESKILVYK